MTNTEVNKLQRAVEEFTDATFGNEDWRKIEYGEFLQLMKVQKKVNSLKWELQKLEKIICART